MRYRTESDHEVRANSLAPTRTHTVRKAHTTVATVSAMHVELAPSRREATPGSGGWLATKRGAERRPYGGGGVELPDVCITFGQVLMVEQ